MRIQHNIMAMNAYRNYNTNTSALSSNLEKLSSGYKINRAGDDAAGLAISEKMRAQISGLEQASSNVKDGISLVKTGEGALQEVQDMLNRMVTLATQSANGTYDNDVDRAQLQKEVDSLTAEIDRIADSSNFNGINLLDGSMDTTTKTTSEKDIGAKAISGAFEIINDGQLGNDATAGVFSLDLSNYTAKGDGKDVTISIFGQKITVKSKVADGETVTGEDIAKAIEQNWDKANTKGTNNFNTAYNVDLVATRDGSKITFTMSDAPSKAWDEDSTVTIDGVKTDSSNQAEGIQLTVDTTPVDSSAGRKYAQASVDLNKLKANIVDGATLTIGDITYTFAVGKDSNFKNSNNVINLTDITADDVKAGDATTIGKIADRITTAAANNKNFKVTTGTPVGGSSDGKLYLTEKEGGVDTENYKLEGKDNTTAPQDGNWSGLIKLGRQDTSKMGTALSLQIGDTSKSYNQLAVSIEDMHAKALGISNIDISTQEGAAKAIDTIKAAINQVSSTRGTLGATQNRLEHTANNLSVMTENIQDAESTIRDTDIAEEMMDYTKNNILVQSAQAMLAQANSVPQGVLQLLQ
jgi:flagellin